MRKLKVELRNVHQKWESKDGQVSSRRVFEYSWQTFGRQGRYNARQDLIARAGWDPAGWVFLNWRELPEKLQYDICCLKLEVIQEIAKYAKSDYQP